MVNIAVCDDSKEYVKIVKDVISRIMSANNIAYSISTFTAGINLVEVYKRKPFDIIFLDMEMPETDGIKTGLLIRELSDKPIIFYLTSHKEYAYESYQVKAKNYLLKPIQCEVLEKELLQTIEELNAPLKFLDIKDIDGIIHHLPIHQITHILRKKEDRKLHIYTLNKEEIIIVQTLKSIENSLSCCSSFKKSSKSCLVNINNIRAIHKNMIVFSNDETEEASRRCLSDLVNLFKKEKEGW
jgi:DNA-binding LytR/AlgR family response regulator